MAQIDNFEAFMKPPVSTEREIFVSDRFKDAKGQVQKVKIKGISSDEIQATVKESARLGEDDYQLTLRLITKCMTYPNLKDKTLCDYYKEYEPEKVFLKIFSQPKEYMAIANAVTKMLGIKNDKQLGAEAKN